MNTFTTLFTTQPSYEQLAEAFDTIEADITYIDDNDIVLYFNPFRIFDRPASCLNENVYDCHPEKVHGAVTRMLDAFREGPSDTHSEETRAPNGRLIRVCYHAIRDAKGAYLGCLEAVTYRD